MRASAFLLCLLTASSCWSQIADIDPDWKELEVPPPAKFNVERMVAIEMPRYVTVKIGVDPDSLTIGTDGIVRYVMIAQSSGGNINAMYEGIWCRKGEVKTYARLGSDGKWDPVKDAQWSPLRRRSFANSNSRISTERRSKDGVAPALSQWRAVVSA